MGLHYRQEWCSSLVNHEVPFSKLTSVIIAQYKIGHVNSAPSVTYDSTVEKTYNSNLCEALIWLIKACGSENENRKIKAFKEKKLITERIDSVQDSVQAIASHPVRDSEGIFSSLINDTTKLRIGLVSHENDGKQT